MSRSALDLNESSETASEGSRTKDGEGVVEIEMVVAENKVALLVKSRKQRRRRFPHCFIRVCMLLLLFLLLEKRRGTGYWTTSSRVFRFHLI